LKLYKADLSAIREQAALPRQRRQRKNIHAIAQKV